MSDAESLQEFVRDASARGKDGKAIRDALLSAGWPEHQVRTALVTYQGEVWGVPVPSPRAKQRPNAWFFSDSAVFAAEIFQIVEWLGVLVAVRYAAIRTESRLLDGIYIFLSLVLAAGTMSCWVRFEWWLWPDLDRSNLRKRHVFVRAIFTLLAAYLISVFSMEVTEQLLKTQLRQ